MQQIHSLRLWEGGGTTNRSKCCGKCSDTGVTVDVSIEITRLYGMLLGIFYDKEADADSYPGVGYQQ